MTLQELLVNDLKLHTKDVLIKDNLKIIIGELQRSDKKVLNDNEVIRILKKLEKSELELLSNLGKDDSDFLNILKQYLPKSVDDTEIIAWINDNVDFTKLKNKMQAVGLVTKHFGPSVDGNHIKEIIQNL